MAFSHWPCREVEVLEEEDVRGDRGLSVFRLRAVSRLTLVVRCTEISYSVSTQVLGFRFGCGWCCVVGFLFGCCWFCVLLLCVSAWWNRGILDEVTKASDGRAVTGTAVMARSANEKKKKSYTGGGREDETDARAEHQTHWRGASNEWMIGVRVSDAVPGIKPIGKTHRKVESKYVRVSTCAED